MLAKGLAERLEARHGGRIESPLYDYRRDPETMLLNPRGIADYSVALADVVARVIDAGEFPVVLGGDCSIVLGWWSEGDIGHRCYINGVLLQPAQPQRCNVHHADLLWLYVPCTMRFVSIDLHSRSARRYVRNHGRLMKYSSEILTDTRAFHTAVSRNLGYAYSRFRIRA